MELPIWVFLLLLVVVGGKWPLLYIIWTFSLKNDHLNLSYSLISGKSVKQKHYFRLGQENLTQVVKNGQEHDTRKWNPQFSWSNEMHPVLFYWKYTSSHLVSRDFRKSVKDDYEWYVIAVVSVAQGSSIMEKDL